MVYGASGHSLAIALQGRHRLLARQLANVVAYIDDFRGGPDKMPDGAPIITFDDWRSQLPDVPCVIALGDPSTRRGLVDKVQSYGGAFARLYDREETRLPCVRIGCGSVISVTSDIGPLTTIGDHVMIMPPCSVAHDGAIGAFATLAASCAIGSHVVLECDVYIGAGATVARGRAGRPLVIGAGARIAAGSVVTKSVPPKSGVAGDPARHLREIARDRLLRYR